MENMQEIDYKQKWDELKTQISDSADILEKKMNDVHRDWIKEFRDRAFELRCVLVTMDDIEKKNRA